MTYTPQPLADGQLANATGILYTVPDGFRAIIDHIVYFNTDSSARVCYLHIDDGTSRQMWQASVGITTRMIVIDNTAPLYLAAANIIKGHAATANVVNYFIYGKLEQKE